MVDYTELRKELYEKFHDAYHKLYVSELQEENKRLRAALGNISDLTITSTVADIYGDTQKEWLEQFDYAQSIARAALEGK